MFISFGMPTMSFLRFLLYWVKEEFVNNTENRSILNKLSNYCNVYYITISPYFFIFFQKMSMLDIRFWNERQTMKQKWLRQRWKKTRIFESFWTERKNKNTSLSWYLLSHHFWQKDNKSIELFTFHYTQAHNNKKCCFCTWCEFYILCICCMFIGFDGLNGKVKKNRKQILFTNNVATIHAMERRKYSLNVLLFLFICSFFFRRNLRLRLIVVERKTTTATQKTCRNFPSNHW